MLYSNILSWKGEVHRMKDIVIDKRENKNGTFSYQYRFEIASVDGKRKWKTKSGFKTKRGAREAAKIAQQTYENIGQTVDSSEMSFSDFLDQWVEMDCKLTCKLSTVQGYQKKIRLYIKPALGSYRLKAITKNNLQEFITDLYNKGFSINTISSIKGILTKSFGYAIDKHYIISNPTIKLIIPKKMQPKKKTRTKGHVYIPSDMIEKIFNRFPEGTSSYIPMMIAYHTGLRLGEIFALVWDDIDFENKTLSVNRQIQWEYVKRSEESKKKTNGTSKSDGYWYFSEPKYNSYRTIEIDDILLNILQKEYRKQLKAKDYYEENYEQYYCEDRLTFSKSNYHTPINKISQNVSDNMINFICRRENGSYISPRTMQHTSHVIHTELNYPEFDTHSLRHTHGTMLRENGAEFVYIQRRLGHKDLGTTIRVYTNHLTDSMKEKGIETLSSMFK